jgi:hypothetical protein
MDIDDQVASLHRQAMEHADAALYFQSHGDFAHFLDETRLAAALEEEAANLLPCSQASEPTRTVLLRSAATLALRCNELERAERLAAMALLGFGPDGLKEEVRDVLEQVHFGRHMAARGVTLEDGELQVSLAGRGVSFGMIAASQYLDRAKSIGNLLRRTGERVLGLPFQKHRGRSREPFPIFMSAPRASSYAITYRLGGAQSFLDGMRGPDAVVATLFDDIQAVNERNWQQLRERIIDQDYFLNFVALLRQIAPDGTDIRLVGFSSRIGGDRREIPFSQPRRELLIDTEGGVGQEVEVIDGLLVGADRGTNIVKVGNHRIRVPPGLIDDIVRPLWGQSVRATVERRPGTASRVLKDVEPLDE